MGSKSGESIRMPKYHMSIHYGICQGPVDEVAAVYIGEKPVHEAPITENSTIHVDNQALFGGIQKEGGVAGAMDFMLGGPEQLAPESLAHRLGRPVAKIPGFRGITSVLLRGFDVLSGGFYLIANNPYLKPISFLVRRFPRPAELDPAYALVSRTDQGDDRKDANPVYIIYECLTNTDWGMGLSPDSIDVPAFQEAAIFVHKPAGAYVNYGLTIGLSLEWSVSSRIQDFIDEVLECIKGVVFTHPETGKMTIRLLGQVSSLGTRPATVLDITPANAVLTSFSRKTWGETINEVKVTYTHPDTHEDVSVYAQDLSNIAIQGCVVSDSKNYRGVRSHELAARLAARDLRESAAPLASCEVTVAPGKVILPFDYVRLVWPELGLDLRMQVMKITYSKKSSEVKLSLLEDYFTQASNIEISKPPQSQWENPYTPPVKATAGGIIPLPLFAVRQSGLRGSMRTDYPSAYGMPVVMRPAGAHPSSVFTAFTKKTLLNGDTEWEESAFDVSFVRSGDLGFRAGYEAVSTWPIPPQLSAPGDWPKPNEFVIITNDSNITGNASNVRAYELGLVLSVDAANMTFTVRRGVLDTAPGGRIGFVGSKTWVHILTGGLEPLSDEFIEGATMRARVVTTSPGGTMDFSQAAEFTGTAVSRHNLPLRPGNIKVNDNILPVHVDPSAPRVFYVESMSAVTVSWAYHNSDLSDSAVPPWDSLGSIPESGQQVVIEVEGSPTLYFDYPTRQHTFDFTGSTSKQLIIYSRNNGLKSWQYFRFHVRPAP